MTLQEIRDYVWTWFEIDSSDMPETLIDRWTRDASTRIARAVNRWPFYEITAEFVTESGVSEYQVDLKEVTAIEGPDGPLDWMGSTEAERRWFWRDSSHTGRPLQWSQWLNQLRLWPKPDAEYTMAVRGYRAADDWVSGGAGAVPDMPEDFHDVLVSYVMHKAFLHQDDPEMAAALLAEYETGLNTLLDSEMSAPSAAPLVVGGRRRPKTLLPDHQPFPWE